MKTTFFVLGFLCLVGTLSASPLNFDLLEEENPVEIPQHFLEVEPQVYPEVEENDDELEVQTRLPPQVHDNAFKSQGPFSAKLANVVANRQGIQKTVQKNSINFNLRFMKALKQLLQEEEVEQNEE